MHGLFPREIKKGNTITKAFQEILDEPGRKSNKIWVDIYGYLILQ